ncbi:hypothetical protein GCM10020260_17410 [Nesterenkonia halobia]|uniref:Uncharacterized protein n=1 Tax=Nesterenkonia halobia TaxID=37922 RepID=A0ABP6REN2_9MICC
MRGTFGDLVARGLTGVELVTSGAHPGLKAEIAPGPAPHDSVPDPLRGESDESDAEGLLAVGEGAAAQHHGIYTYDQPGPTGVDVQFDRVVEVLEAKLPKVADHLAQAREEILAFTSFPSSCGSRSGRTTPMSG